MNIGVLKENPQREGRVAITPANTRALVLRNHKVFVQSGAGEISRFYDEDYLKEGATIVYN
ncbi:alanine dehydrogenase, partial [candidate division KSB1 bacterium]